MDVARVSHVEPLGGRVLRVVFTDGLVRELDFEGALPGVLSVIDDDEVFETVFVDPVARTVSWPVGVDLDPDVLHGDHDAAMGAGPRLVREYHREPARRAPRSPVRPWDVVGRIATMHDEQGVSSVV